MNYKKIIRSRTQRKRILRLLSFIPDKTMLKMQYRIKTGRKLNLKHPARFTEKIQWYKLNYKNPLLIQCVDKYDVRAYVKAKGLEEILVPCFGAFESFDEIPWGDLPDRFVLKDTLSGGGNSVLIVKDKNTAHPEAIRETVQRWVRRDPRKKGSGREWPYYSGNKHRILVEQFLEGDDPAKGLMDYKFFCFHGKAEFLYAMGNRKAGESVSVSIFDRNFRKLPVKRVGDEELADVVRPPCFEKMIETAEILAADFPHVRVDLYNVRGRIYFGELTFYNASGYMQYDPDTFDYDAGEKWVL